MADIHNFDGTHCCQCRRFLEEDERDFTHQCGECWLARTDTRVMLTYAKRVGWHPDYAIEILKRTQMARMN